MRIAIVVARFNDFVTERLLEGAHAALRDAGLADGQIDVLRPIRNRFGDFIGFFDGIAGNGGKALRAIPFATALWVAQGGHDGEEAV